MYRPEFIAVKDVLTFFLPVAALACGGSELLLPDSGGAPANIQIVKGNEQSGVPGSMLRDSIIVKVTDSAGLPISGQQVEFLSDAPGGAVTPPLATTDAAGIAGARWVLGAITGPQEVVARVVGDVGPAQLQVRFTASATAPASVPALVIRTQPSALARIGEVFSRQPVVQIQNAAGGEVKASEVPVTVAVASGGGSLGGTTTRVTDANGRAEFVDLRIDGATGSHVLIFAAAGYTSVVADPIDVSPAEAENQPPLAANDEYETLEGGQRTLTVGTSFAVLRNDLDPEGDPLIASKASDPPNGRVSLERDGSFSYTPDYDFSGDDRFTYRASDPSGGSSTATVTIHVLPINDRPRFRIAEDLVVVRAGEASRAVANFITGITPGPPNEQDQIVTFEVVSNSNPGLFASGPAVIRDRQDRETGTLIFTPAAGQSGSALVTLIMRDNGGTANDGDDTSNPETFTIRVE
jgi:hypothetical protein